MNITKDWYKSKWVMWGITAVLSMLAIVFSIDVSVEDVTTLLDQWTHIYFIATAIAWSLVSIRWRITASTTIKK